MATKEIYSNSREASVFNELALPFLVRQGFMLLDDPSVIKSPYQATSVIYKSDGGLFLTVGFEPADGNNAIVSIGRRWLVKDRFFALSNIYSVLAKHLNIELPLVYKLGYGKEVSKTISLILDDLTTTLPLIIDRVTERDLIFVENERFGARQKAIMQFGTGYADHVKVSQF